MLTQISRKDIDRCVKCHQRLLQDEDEQLYAYCSGHHWAIVVPTVPITCHAFHFQFYRLVQAQSIPLNLQQQLNRMTAKTLAMAIAVGAALISHALVSFHIADDSSLRASIQDPVDPFLLAIGGLPLSSHLSVVHTPDRASEIATMRSLIFNEQRTWRIGSFEDGIDHPFYDGPVFHPGSLADRIRLYELEYVMNGIPESTKLLVGVAIALQSQMNSPETYTGFYRTMDTLMTAPKATLDLTDEHFGDQRLGLRGFGMRRVNSNSFDETVDIASFGPTLLTNKQVAEVCNSEINTSLADLRAAGRLFVIDLSHLKQFHVVGTIGPTTEGPLERAGSCHLQVHWYEQMQGGDLSGRMKIS